MAGRTRKIIDIATGKIGKQKRINRKIQEENVKLDREALENGAPEWLNEIAAEEYNRVVYEASKINLLDNLDLSILAIYADTYSRYVETTKALNQLGTTVTIGDREFVSPLVTIQDKAMTQILKCSTKLGLAATDRLKLVVPTKEEKSVNKFLEFVK